MSRRHYALTAVTLATALAYSLAASAQTTTIAFATAATIGVGSPPPLVSTPLADVANLAFASGERVSFTENPRVLKSLRFGFIGVQALDVHSTWKALSGGAREGNAVMRPLTSSPAAYMAIKAGMTFLVYKGTERGGKRHAKTMFWLLVASDAAMSAIAIHNYRVAGR